MGQWELLIWLYGPMGASHLVKTKPTLTDELPSAILKSPPLIAALPPPAPPLGGGGLRIGLGAAEAAVRRLRLRAGFAVVGQGSQVLKCSFIISHVQIQRYEAWPAFQEPKCCRPKTEIYLNFSQPWSVVCAIGPIRLLALMSL